MEDGLAQAHARRDCNAGAVVRRGVSPKVRSLRSSRSSSTATRRSITISSRGAPTRSRCSMPGCGSRAGRARATRSRRTRRRSQARPRCAASTFRRTLAIRISSAAGRRSATRPPPGSPGSCSRTRASCTWCCRTAGVCPARHGAGVSRVQQPARRQPPLHDRPRGARPDGGGGLARRGRRPRPGRDVRAGVKAAGAASRLTPP